MNVLFLGTPAFAVQSLNALANSSHKVVGVITQPDRAVKRGKTESSPVKYAAVRLGLPVFQPDRIRDETDCLKSYGADIAVTAAYGQILTQGVLDCFPKGVINVHASLLPKYRGASPIYSAILNGEKITGVTIMKTELGLDTGDILSAEEVEIGRDETATELTERLAVVGAKLLIDTLDRFDDIKPIKQDDAFATKCKTIRKDETYIDFGKSAEQVVNQVRALCESPCARAVLDGQVYKIYKVVRTDADYAGVPGQVVECGNRLVVACGDGAVEIKSIQAPGKNRLDIADFLRGRKFAVGESFGKPQ